MRIQKLLITISFIVSLQAIFVQNNDTKAHALAFLGAGGEQRMIYLEPSMLKRKITVPFKIKDVQWTQNVSVTVLPSRADEDTTIITFSALRTAPLQDGAQHIIITRNGLAIDGKEIASGFVYNISPDRQESKVREFMQAARSASQVLF